MCKFDNIMDSKLCKNLYFVKTNSTDKLDDELINFLKESKINLIFGDDPINYIRQTIKNWKETQQVQQINNKETTLSTNQSQNLNIELDNLEQNLKTDNNRQIELTKTDNPLNRTVFVFREFNGNDVFKQVNFHTNSILGLTAIQYFFNCKSPIPMNVRPIHNFCMKDLYICFANLTEREQAQRYIILLRYMGGSSRKELNTEKITHLISNKSSGNKYRIAITCGLPVMNLSWIDYSWEHRFDPDFKANDPEVIDNFKLKPFSKLNLAFVNFSNDDIEEIKDLTLKNEGKFVNWDDEKCTHIIIDAIPGDSVDLPIDLSIINKNVYLVYKEWFWASLEITARADEKIANHAYPLSNNTNHNRTINQSTINQSVCTILGDSRNLSCDLLSPTLDFSTDSILDSGFVNNNNKSIIENQVDYKNFSKRRKICCELLDTEKNYLEVLRVIVNIFYKPLEEQSNLNQNDQSNKQLPLLDNTERKIIFGNIPPILEIHEGIYNDLQKTIEKWDENCSIGNVFIKYSGALLKTYPSFSNFFENTKETLVRCDEKYPRFHAFLKKNQSRPECKRQSLAELLIRPVQRLPSISLLLNDLLKHTDKNLIDNKQLKLAIEKINEVLLHLNEDKRKTEGQIEMFDIVNDIEECPASLLSANRHFIMKSDAKLILKNDNKLSPMKNCVMTIFLFNDVLEFCKKRSIKRTESLNQKNSKTISISNNGSNSKSFKKSYKHVDTLPLDFIKVIYHFSLLEDSQNCLSIVTNPNLYGTSRTYRVYPFVLEDKEIKPEVFISNLCRQISIPNIIINDDSLTETLNTDFEYVESLAKKLNKSDFGFAKTKEKITRAFSMKKSNNNNNNNNNTFITPQFNRINYTTNDKSTVHDNDKSIVHDNEKSVLNDNDKSNLHDIDKSILNDNDKSVLYDKSNTIVNNRLDTNFLTPQTKMARNKKTTSFFTQTPKISRTFSSFINMGSSSFMNLGSPLNSSKRRISITNVRDINDDDLNGTFSCPSTPALSKKSKLPEIVN